MKHTTIGQAVAELWEKGEVTLPTQEGIKEKALAIVQAFHSYFQGSYAMHWQVAKNIEIKVVKREAVRSRNGSGDGPLRRVSCSSTGAAA